MGLQDREYYRDGAADEFTLESLSVIVRIIILNVVVLVLDLLFGQGEDKLILKYFSVSHATALNPLLWFQYLTAGFLHQDVSHLFFNMIGLYIFGRELEYHLGKREMAWFYLTAIVLGNVVWSVRDLLGLGAGPGVIGASGGVMAVVILFCLKFPLAEIFVLFFRVPAWMIGTFYVLSDLAGMMSPAANFLGSNTAYEVHLAGAFFAAVYWYFHLRLSSLGEWSVFQNIKHWLRRRRGPKLRVHRAPDDDDVGSYEDEADRILAKIHESGESSLTAKERKFLEEYSRRVRNRRQ